MRGMTGKGESNFATIDAETGAVRVLAQRDAAGAPSWGDGSCEAPDRTPGFHGFDRWTGPDGRVRGRFRATGIRPKCSDRLASSGVHLPMEMFEHVKMIA